MATINIATDPGAADATDDHLEAIAKEIESLQATAVFHIAERLAKVRDIFRYRRDEGGFAGWVETRLHFSRASAYNLLHVHERFGGQHSVKYLDTLRASVLYLLAAPSTPEEARTEIIERADAGEKLPVAKVKRVVEKHKGKQPSPRATGASTKPKSSASALTHFEVGAELKELIATKVPGWTGATVGTQAEVDAAIERLRDDGAPGHWLIVAPRERVVIDHRVIQWLLLTAPAPPVIAHIDWAFSLCSAATKARCPIWFSERLSGKSHPQRAGISWPLELPLPRNDVGPASAGEAARKDAEIEELRNAKRQFEIRIIGLESEITELKTRREPASTGTLRDLSREKAGDATERLCLRSACGNP